MVTPPVREGVDASKYQERAAACKDIQFDYDAYSAQCETFCQYIHGNWEGNFQIPTGGGQHTLGGFTRSSKLFKSHDKPLKEQVIRKITAAKLIFSDEKF